MNRNCAVKAFTAVATAMAVTITSAAADPSAAAERKGADVDLTRSAITLARQAGFADIDTVKLTATKPASTAVLTPTLAVELKPTTNPALSDGTTTFNGAAADGTVAVVRFGGFGVVTNHHDKLEFRYKTVSTARTTLIGSADGGLDEVTPSGTIVGHIDPAYAIDSTNARIPASYDYDRFTNELVVRADTTGAKGAVFIDPSWRCMAVLAAYGLGTIAVVAGWIFSSGSVVWLAWALRTWFGVNINIANIIARTCVS